jgi:hypothetical protein
MSENRMLAGLTSVIVCSDNHSSSSNSSGNDVLLISCRYQLVQQVQQSTAADADQTVGCDCTCSVRLVWLKRGLRRLISLLTRSSMYYATI